MDAGFRTRSCSNNKLERDDDSEKSHPALGQGSCVMRAFLKTTETFAPGALSLPGRYYTSQDVFAAEREAIFARHWTCVGRAEDIENPGDFFLTRIADESVIVLRDDDGHARAFYNVCRHRGTAICVNDSGNLPGRLRCPYHGWTYDLKGRLMAAPLMEQVPEFDASAYPLHSIPVEVCEGSYSSRLPSSRNRLRKPLRRISPIFGPGL